MSALRYEQSTRCFPVKVDYTDVQKEESGVFDESVILGMFKSGEIGWAKMCSLLGVGVTDKITIGNETIHWV